MHGWPPVFESRLGQSPLSKKRHTVAHFRLARKNPPLFLMSPVPLRLGSAAVLSAGGDQGAPNGKLKVDQNTVWSGALLSGSDPTCATRPT